MTPTTPVPANLRYVGDYELLEELARGGMGTVFRARQRTLGRPVAVKLIHPQLAGDERAVERFRREACLAARLAHPHIVPIHEIGEDQGRLFYSMELVEGRDLSRLLEAGPLAPADAAVLVGKLARAVEYAHGQDVLHRDLKPANVLVDARGEPRITDFGLARALGSSSLTMSGDILGTPAYMAPEQARGLPGLIGRASDVYALGALLFQALTGRPPFAAPHVAGVLRAVLEDEPPVPSSLRPGVPADLDAITLRCLEKDPVRRYATAAALAEDLERFARGDPVSARPPGRLRRVVAWWRSHPMTRAVALAMAFVALAGLAFHFWTSARWIAAGRPAPDPDDRDLAKAAFSIATVIAMPAFVANARLKRRQGRRRLHGEPIEPRFLRRCLLLGAFAALSGLASVGMCIQLQVWSGKVPWLSALPSLTWSLLGVAMALNALREWRARLGGEDAQVASADLQRIRELMLAGDEVAALRLYRKRTRAPLAESRRAVRVIAGLEAP